MLWASTRALRSLLTLFWPRNFLRNLVLYFRLSPQTPHCHASRCWIPGESSQVHLSIRPELHALASAWVSAAEDTASRNAVSLKAVAEGSGEVEEKKKYLKLHFFKALDAKAIGALKHLLWKNKIYDKMLFASLINLLSQNVYRGLDALSGFTTTSAILQVLLRRNSSPDISFWFCTVICFTQSHHHGIFWSN